VQGEVRGGASRFEGKGMRGNKCLLQFVEPGKVDVWAFGGSTVIIKRKENEQN